MKKKFIFAFLLFFMLGTFMPNVYADDFTCTALGNDILIDTQLADIVHLIILIIQIAIPILLVVFGMMDLTKGVMAQKEDEIKKGQQTFVKRLVAAVIVFFVIAVVKLVVNAVAKNDSGIMACANCFLEGSDSDGCNATTQTVETEETEETDEGFNV